MENKFSIFNFQISIIWSIVLIGCLPINKALAQQGGDAERNTLRIMSYNIRNGRGMDEVTDLGAYSGRYT